MLHKRALSARTRLLWHTPRPLRRTFVTRGTRFELNTGDSIPALGVGTFQDADAQVNAVSLALSKGYRLIDTARVYEVEKQVGEGVRKSGVPRSELFIGTKLWCNDYHPEDVERALDDSLQDLGMDYVDLLMMHYPVTFKRGPDPFPRDVSGKMQHGETTFLDTWKAMQELVTKGKARNIGVSNFCQAEIQELITKSNTVPAVHQMEVHPYLQQKGFNAWLRSKGIHVIQFSPLGNSNDFYRTTGWSKEIAHMPKIFENELMKEIGNRYGRTPAQIALAWGINNRRSVIPKSTIEWQIEQNLEADFQLREEDMLRIAEVDVKARFNDPSMDYGYRLYSDLEGIEGTRDGKTH